MRVASKRIHARNDCFDAAEGSSSVRIATLRHTTLVSVQNSAGEIITDELSLTDLANVVFKALSEKQEHH